MGPFESTELPQLHISQFKVIPKCMQGKWRLIPDPVLARGSQCEQWDQRSPLLLVVRLHWRCCRDGAQERVGCSPTHVVKVDIRNNRWLLGMRWEEALYMYVDTALPCGLSSAPKIFTGVADAVEWIAKREGVDSVLHYLDDYLVVGLPESDECTRFLSTLTSLCARLGLPVALEKLEGLTCVLTFLGIEIDTLNM